MASTKKITPFPATAPIARFFQAVASPRPPRRADRSVGGTLPTRALRYCTPVSAASAFGWLVFLPVAFKLRWDGHAVFYQLGDEDEWTPLGSINYPGFDEEFDAAAPETAQGYAPPFLSAGAQPGNVQIWPGGFVSTAPGWSMLVRPVANLARPSGYELFEGIIETDVWFGPLFTNVRLTRTDIPIVFESNVPFMQLQPLHRSSYDDKVLASFVVEGGMDRLTPSEWQRYEETVVLPNKSPELRRRGREAVRNRKRQSEDA